MLILLFAFIVSLSVESKGSCSSSSLSIADIIHNHGDFGVAFASAIWAGACCDFVGTSLDTLTIVEIAGLDVQDLV